MKPHSRMSPRSPESLKGVCSGLCCILMGCGLSVACVFPTVYEALTKVLVRESRSES